jgi:hypothetical protein
MKLMSPGKMAIAIPTFACATLLSFGWSEQHGVSLSVESAQARVGRPLTPVSVAGVARRQNRRAAYGYGAAVGAGLAAGAVGAAAVAATSPYYGNGYYQNAYYGNGYDNNAAYYGGNYYGAGYFASSPWGDYECRNPHGYPCNSYASKDWWGGRGAPAGYVGAGYYGAGAGYYGHPVAGRAAYYGATGY